MLTTDYTNIHRSGKQSCPCEDCQCDPCECEEEEEENND